MDIRPASTADGPAIWTLLEPVFRAGDTYAIDPDITAAAALDYWMSEHVFIAEADGVAAGTYYMRRNQHGRGDHVCNCGFIAAASAQGRGVARSMLAHAIEVAPGLGFEAMQFNFVLANNRRAIEIWTRAGFERVGRIPRAFRHPADGYVDALIFWKDLRDE